MSEKMTMEEIRVRQAVIKANKEERLKKQAEEVKAMEEEALEEEALEAAASEAEKLAEKDEGKTLQELNRQLEDMQHELQKEQENNEKYKSQPGKYYKNLARKAEEAIKVLEDDISDIKSEISELTSQEDNPEIQTELPVESERKSELEIKNNEKSEVLQKITTLTSAIEAKSSEIEDVKNLPEINAAIKAVKEEQLKQLELEKTNLESEKSEEEVKVSDIDKAIEALKQIDDNIVQDVVETILLEESTPNKLFKTVHFNEKEFIVDQNDTKCFDVSEGKVLSLDVGCEELTYSIVSNELIELIADA